VPPGVPCQVAQLESSEEWEPLRQLALSEGFVLP